MTLRLKQVELVGAGAMAEVHRGLLTGERGVGKTVAIKRLRAELRKDPEAVELFVNEAKIAVCLDHPNVVRGLEFARDDEGYYLVFEWLDCTTAADLHESVGPLPWHVVAAMGESLCDALTYIHGLAGQDGAALGVVHRDVTPANVYVTADGRVKLGDFGVAFCRGHAESLQICEVGTPGFAAPEQANGRWDIRSDVYGLGATLECLTADLPAQLDAVLARAMDPDPDARFVDAAAFKAALGAAASSARKSSGAQSLPETLRDLVARHGTSSATPTPRLDGAVQSILGGALDVEPAAIRSLALLTETQPAPKMMSRRLLLSVSAGVAVCALGAALWLGGGFGRSDDNHEVATSPPAVASIAEPDAAGAGESPVATEAPAPEASQGPGADTTNAIGNKAPMSTEAPAATEAPAPAPAPAPRPRSHRISSRASFNALPWAEVTIDGVVRGNTPLRDVDLTVGPHRLVLRHPPDGTTRAFSIRVESDRRHAFLFDLRRGTVTRRLLPP